MAKNRISELDVASVGFISVRENSPDALNIDPRYTRIITGNPQKKYSITGESGVYDAVIKDEPYEKPGVPHMDDISIIKNSTYVDAKNNVRTKIIFRVKNSTGEAIKGVDARLEVKTGDDQ
jgi:hypothetical protein